MICCQKRVPCKLLQIFKKCIFSPLAPLRHKVQRNQRGMFWRFINNTKAYEGITLLLTKIPNLPDFPPENSDNL